MHGHAAIGVAIVMFVVPVTVMMAVMIMPGVMLMAAVMVMALIVAVPRMMTMLLMMRVMPMLLLRALKNDAVMNAAIVMTPVGIVVRMMRVTNMMMVMLMVAVAAVMTMVLVATMIPMMRMMIVVLVAPLMMMVMAVALVPVMTAAVEAAMAVMEPPIGVYREAHDRQINAGAVKRHQHPAIVVGELQIPAINPAPIALPTHVTPVVALEAAMNMHAGAAVHGGDDGEIGRRAGAHVHVGGGEPGPRQGSRRRCRRHRQDGSHNDGLFFHKMSVLLAA